jgi:hypothetical protein
MRTTPVGPVVEPALPTGDPLQGTPGAPGATTRPPASGDSLISPTLPPPPDESTAPKETDVGGATSPAELEKTGAKKTPKRE